jgi:hypothetical protein
MQTSKYILTSAATILGTVLVANAASAQGVRVDPREYDRVLEQNTYGTAAPKQSYTSNKQRSYASETLPGEPVQKVQKHKNSRK